MKATCHCLALLILAPVALADGQTDEKSAVTSEALDADLKRVEELPSEQKFEHLGDLLLSLRAQSIKENTVASTAAFTKVQNQMLGTPGHAIHFAFHLRRLRTQSTLSLNSYPVYEAYAARAFQILELLPSTETVRIVSSFLDDSWIPATASDAGCPSVNAQRILGALLQDPPRTERPFDVPSWQSWRKAVDAGTRTFKLKGSNTESNFSGPAGNESSEQATPSKGDKSSK